MSEARVVDTSSAKVADAVRFCCTSPTAVVLTVWPSGTGELAEVERWIASSGAQIVRGPFCCERV